MATDGWQVREWEAAGRIMLGLPYLDAESLALVIGALLTLCNGRVRRLPKMATAPLQTEGHAEEGAVVGAGSGRSAGSSYDAVEMQGDAATPQGDAGRCSYDAVQMALVQGDAGRYREVQGDTGRYREMARALVRRERGLLEGAFTRAVLQLECDGSKDDDDDDDDEDDDDVDVDDDDDDDDDDGGGGGEEGVEKDEDDEDDEGDGDEDGAVGQPSARAPGLGSKRARNA